MPLRILPIRTRRRIRIVNLPLRTQPTPILLDQKPGPIIKIRIPLDIRHGVQPRQRHLQEPLDLRVAAPRRIDPELRDPDRLLRDVVRELDVVLQVAEGVDVAVPVDGHEVDGAVGAVAHELAEPGQAAGRPAVGDRGGAQACFAGEGLHVLAPGAHGLVDGHAGGAWVAEVGLVEAEETVGAEVDGALGHLWPDFEEVRVVVEEEGDEGEGGVEVGGVGRGVVLCSVRFENLYFHIAREIMYLVIVIIPPGDLRVLARQGVVFRQGVVCVAETSLAVVADGCCGGNGRSGR